MNRIVVLASGSGTNAEALMTACRDGRLDAEIIAVVTNHADAGVVERAERFAVPVVHCEHHGRDAAQRLAADQRLIGELDRLRPDLVVLAGWMRILSAEVGAAHRLINLHPALPGAFPGLRAIERAFDAWNAGDIVESGVMVHWVPDDGVDVGPVIVSKAVPFTNGDSLSSFAARVHACEHELIVEGARQALLLGAPNVTQTGDCSA